MKRGFIIICSLALLCLTSCVKEEARTIDGYSIVNVGDQLPMFSVVDNRGNTISNESLKGGYAFILFFYTPCPDCQRALPILNSLYNTYADNPQLKWICIGRSEPQNNVDDYWAAHQYTIPYSYQTDRTVYSLFASQGIPRLYLINPEGVVINQYNDFNFPTESDLENQIANWLK